MKYPSLNQSGVYKVTVPELSGGINLTESENLINDNQLSDLCNMWWKDSQLKTRPDLCSSFFHIFGQDNKSLSIRKTEIYKTDEGIKRNVFAAVQITGRNYLKISLFYINGSGEAEYYPSREKSTVFNKYLPNYTLTGFNAFEHDGDAYVFIGAEYEGALEHKIIKIQANGTVCEISDNEIYAPLVLINGNAITTYTSECNGTLFEGYNLLTDRYRAVYSTYNLANTRTDSDGKLRHEMVYNLPTMPKVGSEVVIKHTLKNGNVATHALTVTSNTQSILEPTKNSQDGLRVLILGTRICFFESSEYLYKDVYADDYIKDNLEITASHSFECDYKRIFNMNVSTLFGGNSSGINGGTRLFLGGNKTYPELVCWSDLNNPLYFSENSYFHVGNKGEAVTAFGKQSDMLVIFKENEIFAAGYAQTTAQSDQDSMSSNVDITQSTAYFPIVQIHSRLGCDCPNSVQLCKNRLVWANSSGKIYTLVTANQYSESNVYELSAMIDKKLSEIGRDALKTACSADCFNCYILFSQNKAFVLNYGSYAFSKVYAYSDSDKAQKNISWYYWEFNDDVIHAFSADNALYFVLNGKTASMSSFSGFDIYKNGDTVVKTPINCTLTTKCFDFSNPQSFKKILQIFIGLSSSNEQPAVISFSGTDWRGGEVMVYAAYINNGIFKITPERPRIKDIKIKIEAKGSINIYNIALYYKLLGGVK